MRVINDDVNPNRADLNSIESDFVERLQKTQFNNDPYFLSQLKQAYLANRKYGLLGFDLKSFYEKRYVNNSERCNKIIVFSAEAYIVNNSPLPQTLETTAFTRTVEKSNELIISKTFGFELSVGANIKIPFASTKVEFKASYSQTVTASQKYMESETVSAPSQKVDANPFTKVKVQYNVYQYDNIFNYMLDFEVEPRSKDLFGFFVHKMGNGQYGQKDLRLHNLNDTIVMKNLPQTERLQSVGVELNIFPEEKLSEEEKRVYPKTSIVS